MHAHGRLAGEPSMRAHALRQQPTRQAHTNTSPTPSMLTCEHTHTHARACTHTRAHPHRYPVTHTHTHIHAGSSADCIHTNKFGAFSDFACGCVPNSSVRSFFFCVCHWLAGWCPRISHRAVELAPPSFECTHTHTRYSPHGVSPVARTFCRRQFLPPSVRPSVPKRASEVVLGPALLHWLVSRIAQRGPDPYQ